MFNVTTKYDNVNGERRKVFIIRGDESYAKTVDVVLSSERGSAISDSITGFPVTLTAKLYRNLGDSVLVFYDGEEPIDMLDTHDYQSEYTLPIRLEWGEEHKLWVEYKANTQTMGKKSKSITLHEDIPVDYVPTITLTSNSQIGESTSYTATGRVQFLNENVLNGTEVVVSLDGEVIDTVTTTNGVFSCSLGTIERGVHTVTAETLSSETMNAKTQSFTVSAGYEVNIIKYPPTIMDGTSSEFKISVKTLEGNPVNNATVSFNGTNYTTNTQGIATFNLSTIATGSYRASCGGSYSEYVDIELISSPTLTVTTTGLVAQNETLPIDVNVTSGSGLKVKVYESNSSSASLSEWIPSSELTLDKNGSATYYYNAESKGEVALKFTTLNLSEVVTIYDTIGYFSASDGGVHNLKVSNYGVTNFTSPTTQNMELSFRDNGLIQLDAITGINNSNVFEMSVMEANDVQTRLSFHYGNRIVYECDPEDIANSDLKIKYDHDNNRAIISIDGELVSVTDTNTPTENRGWNVMSRKYTSTPSRNLKLVISDIKIYKE